MVEKSYYISKYLKIVPSHRKTALLFNGFTGAIDEVSCEIAKTIKKFMKNNSENLISNLSCFSESEIKFLENRGHITKLSMAKEISDFCQLTHELDKYMRYKILTRGNLMLVPSYNCNLSCSYCFEQDVMTKQNRAKVMTPSQIDRLFGKLLEKLFPEPKDKSKISVDLYGGEPFLPRNYKTIERILFYTQKNKMRVSAITNGTCVEKALDFFGDKEGLINMAQVTFDGGKSNHDKSRVGTNCEPTFEKIMKNIHLLISKKAYVDIRINCQKKTLPSLINLWKRLEKEGLLKNQYIDCYTWPVHSNYVDKSCADLEHKELSAFLKDHGMNIKCPVNRWEDLLKKVISATKGMPLQRTVYCMKCKPNSFAYDAFDDLYLCYDECGRKDKRCGYINDKNEIVFLKEYEESQKRVVANIEKCKTCCLALLCAGGCPTEAERYNGTMYSPGCGSFSECFDIALKESYRKKIEAESDKKNVSKIQSQDILKKGKVVSCQR